MQYKQHNNIHFVYLEKGDSAVDDLTEFCKSQKIYNGFINGIGAVNNVELGSYDARNKVYIRKEFIEDRELISYQGNIMILDGEPFIHAHATIGNHSMEVFGGHVFKMNIAVVGEFVIQKIESKHSRELNNDIGLATWDLTN